MARKPLAVVFSTLAMVAGGAVLVTLAQERAPVTFHKQVEPILQKNCQGCHRPGQIAPMSFLTYQDVRPWARSIKNAVANRTMPPWFADLNAHVLNDRRLSESDIETITRWIDDGAREGNSSDAPQPVQWPAEGWRIKPDYVVEGPTYDVPAKASRVDVVRRAWRLHEGHMGDVYRGTAQPACRDASRVSVVRAAHA